MLRTLAPGFYHPRDSLFQDAFTNAGPVVVCLVLVVVSAVWAVTGLVQCVKRGCDRQAARAAPVVGMKPKRH